MLCTDVPHVQLDAVAAAAGHTTTVVQVATNGPGGVRAGDLVRVDVDQDEGELNVYEVRDQHGWRFVVAEPFGAPANAERIGALVARQSPVAL